jgi:hypothetical protein
VFVVLVDIVFGSAQMVGVRTYSLDHFGVVDRDGSLWIDETRTYTYDGQYSWAEFRLLLERAGSTSEFSLFGRDRMFTPSATEEPGIYALESRARELYVRWHCGAEDEPRSFRLRPRVCFGETAG